MSWDPKRFDIEGCLEQFGFVDWRQYLNVSKGDIVFIYGKKPFGQIAYMFQVLESDINPDDTIDDSAFAHWNISPADKYCRLKLLASSPDDSQALSYDALKTQGVKSSLQRGIYLSDKLANYILTNFDVVPSDDGTTFSEGSLRFVTQSHYERDPSARKACLTAKGYKCFVCSFDFEKVYGILGHKFIHVHHITPLASMLGKSVKTNPLKDLIPVCPNCHAMLHRKLHGKYLSPTELKSIISK